MAQQTAVEWLVNELKSYTFHERIDMAEWKELKKLSRKAKQMEKERHDKWNEFLNAEKTLGVSDVKTIERIQWYYNQYFKETYEK